MVQDSHLMPLIVLGTTQVLGDPRKHSMAVAVQWMGGGVVPSTVSLLPTLEVVLFAGEEGHEDRDGEVFLASSNLAR